MVGLRVEECVIMYGGGFERVVFHHIRPQADTSGGYHLPQEES